MTTEGTPGPAEQDGERKADPIARGIGIGCLGIIGAVAALLVFGILFGGDDDRGAQVKIACREWVQERLKSPGSADFSNESVENYGDTYVVTGYVDSDNSFGASIRNEFRCKATNSGGSTQLVSLTGLNN